MKNAKRIILCIPLCRTSKQVYSKNNRNILEVKKNPAVYFECQTKTDKKGNVCRKDMQIRRRSGRLN